jgi:hypothetical protein
VLVVDLESIELAIRGFGFASMPHAEQFLLSSNIKFKCVVVVHTPK